MVRQLMDIVRPPIDSVHPLIDRVRPLIGVVRRPIDHVRRRVGRARALATPGPSFQGLGTAPRAGASLSERLVCEHAGSDQRHEGQAR